MTKQIKTIILLILSVALMVNVLAGCRKSKIEEQEPTTETLQQELELKATDKQSLEEKADVALLKDKDGNQIAVKGKIIENTGDKVTILDDATGEEIEVDKKDLLPADTKYVKTTVKTDDGKTITIEGAVLAEKNGKTTVVDIKTGREYIVDSDKTSATTVPVVTSKQSQLLLDLTDTTAGSKKTETASTNDTKPTTQTTRQTTTTQAGTQNNNAAPTTKATAAPTTQATTAAPTSPPGYPSNYATASSCTYY